jgi:uncharacterized membrane protein
VSNRRNYGNSAFRYGTSNNFRIKSSQIACRTTTTSNDNNVSRLVRIYFSERISYYFLRSVALHLNWINDYVNVSAVANVKLLPLGTDNFGRDVLKELVSATGTSILIGIIGVTKTESSADVNRKQKLGKKLAVIVFAMPFCYAIIDALGSFLDIFFLEMETSPLIGITEENIELVANISYELTFAICGLILFIFMKLKQVRFELPKQKDKFAAAVCETAGQLTYVYAMSGNGAIAAPILSSVCVVSLLLSRIFLKEKLTKKQYLFISIIIVGILMLAVLEGE